MAGMSTPVKEGKPPTNAGSPKRTAGIHNGIEGNEYQIYVTLYILLRAFNIYSSKEQTFELRMEPSEALVGKFDDISLKVGNEEILIQVKHGPKKGSLTEQNLLTNGSKGNRSLYELRDSVDKSTMKRKGVTVCYVFLTNQSINTNARPMFVPFTSDCALSHIFQARGFLKVWKSAERCKALCENGNTFFDDFVMFSGAPDLADLWVQIEAEVGKHIPVDYEFCTYFLLEELRKWVCNKENREGDPMGKQWTIERLEDFRDKQKKKWDKYKDLVISTIKESKASQIEERAEKLYDEIKNIFTNVGLDIADVKKEKPTMEQDVTEDDINQLVPTGAAINQIHTLRQTLQLSREFKDKDTHHLFIQFKIANGNEKLKNFINLNKERLPTNCYKELRRISESPTLDKGDLHFLVNFGLKQAKLNTTGSIFEDSKSSSVLHCGNQVDLIGKTFNHIAEQYIALKEIAANVGLIMDPSKTKYMIADGSCQIQSNPKIIGGDKIKQVGEIMFLGSLVTWNNSCKEDIESRIEFGVRRYEVFEEIFKSDLNYHDKWSIYEEKIRSKVLYGCETWTVLASEEAKLKTFDDEMQRIILIDMKNYERKPDSCKSILWTICARQVCWAGQVARMSSNEPAKSVLERIIKADVGGKRRRGKPRTRWLDAMNDCVIRMKKGRHWNGNLEETWTQVKKEFYTENPLKENN